MSLPWQPSIENDPSIWITPCTPFIINENPGSGEKQFTEGGRWYVRILPTHFDPESMDNVALLSPPISNHGYSWGETKGGRIAYCGSLRAQGLGAELRGATMWFRSNGEIWFTQEGVSGEYQGRQHFYGDDIARHWGGCLKRGLNILKNNGGNGPYHIRLGVTGIGELCWQLGDFQWGEPNRALDNRLENDFITNDIEYNDWETEFWNVFAELRRVFSLSAPNMEQKNEIISRFNNW